ncbi:MAG: ABC transporter ATP-binding protein [Candidatus Eremiobacteraeota bacterium]|nr:ABC transporter ATP-binding protein [Candidatus Eremiobacteraeota bacterium]
MATILETRDLCKSFSGYRAIDGVSLAIESGSIHAIIGPNGAGKTTFFNLLSGFVAPTAGTISLGGRDISGLSPYKIARLGVVRSFQINSIFTHLSVLDNVKVSLESKTNLPSRFWLPGKATNRFDARARELLADVGLERERDLLAAQLSYGRKRALELAISLAQDPAVLLLDEPTAGMGTEDVGAVSQLIARVRTGRTIVLVEHNLSVVADLSDRITVLQRGKVLVEGTYDEVRADARVVDAYLGGGGGVHA